MKTKWEIILAGTGGQGLGVAGQVLGQAAILDKDYNVAHNQSYGARARGGSSQSTIIISREEIIYPMVEKADLLISLTPEAYSKFEPQVNDTGTIIYDSGTPTNPVGRVKEFGYSFYREAKKMGHPRGITIMALGAAVELLGLISPGAVVATMEQFFKGKILEVNVKAFQRGREIAEQQPSVNPG